MPKLVDENYSEAARKDLDRAHGDSAPGGHGSEVDKDSTADFRPEEQKSSVTKASGKAFEKLAAYCRAQLRKRGLGENKEYVDRLECELAEIKSQGEADYLRDLLRRCIDEGVQFENENGLLAEWLLDITPTDPVAEKVPHRHKFFGDAPDIDLDFCSIRKHEVESYLVEKYGRDHVVHIGAYGTFSAKSAIKEIARVYGLMETGSESELWVNKFATTFNPYEPIRKESMEWNLAYVFGKEEFDGDRLPPSPWTAGEIDQGRKFYESNREVFDIASKVVGQITHFTAHAAGVGIFPRPAWEHLPLKYNPRKKLEGGGSGQIQTAVTEGMRFKEITKAGIIKIDVLGLVTNSIISMAIDLIYKRQGVDLWDAIWPLCPRATKAKLEAGEPVLDIEDDRILSEARQGHNCGTFQFASSGISKLLTRIHPDSFEDLIAANALYRPGTLAAGEAEAFAWRKALRKKRRREPLSAIEKKVLSEGYKKDENDKPQPKYKDLGQLHPALGELLSDTHGTLVYQEQVMATFAKVAGFNMQEADGARKTLIKASQALDREEKLASLYAKTAVGAKERGMSEKDVKTLVETLAAYSGYSFNKSHSSSYALAYTQVQFLKIYYPIEFLAALLSFSKNSKGEKRREDEGDMHLHMQEARRIGVAVVRPLCNHAGDGTTIHKYDDLALHLKKSDSKSLGGEVLMLGLKHLLGVGGKQAAAITAIYPVEDLEDFCDRVDGRVVNKNVMALLIRIGFFDTLYEDEPPEVQRILAWKHYHENQQGLMTMLAAIDQTQVRYNEAKEQIAAITLTRAVLKQIDDLKEKAKRMAKDMDGQAKMELHAKKRGLIRRVDPEGEEMQLRSLLKEQEKCRKIKEKLLAHPERMVYKDIKDDTEERVEIERQVYGSNIYTSALKPYMKRIKEMVILAEKHDYKVAVPDMIDKIQGTVRGLTMVGELQAVRKHPYTERKSGRHKMRLMAKLLGRRGISIELVAFDLSDSMWAAAKENEYGIVAVTGRLGEYNNAPQIMISKRTEWSRREGIEAFERFEENFRKLARN